MKRKIFLALFLISAFSIQAFGFNGDVKWQRDFGAGNSITSGIIVSGNNLLFGDVNGNFYAVNKNSGSRIWTASGNSGYGVEGYPAVTSNGNVVFTQSDGTITCLKISDGSIVWNFIPNENRSETVNDGAVAGAGLIFMVKSDAKLYALNENDGSIAWTYKASSQGLRTAPKYSDGIVFLGEYDGIFSMIDAKTGTRINGGGAGGAVNTPEVANGVVYFSAWDGSINAVQIKSVIPLWDINIGDTVTTPPSINNGIIAVGTGRGTIAGINAKDGSILWKYETENGEISKNILNSGGAIMAGSDSGEIYVLNAKSGRLQTKVASKAGMSTDGAFSDGVFYFASDNKVYAID